MTMKTGPVNLRAWRWGWTVFMVLATSVPYLLNYYSTPAGFHYTWIVPPYFEDSLAYMAWSQQAAHGSILFQIKYTALPNTPFLFHPLFLICGWLSSLFACDVGVVHWLVKSVGVALFFAMFFKYAGYLRLNGLQTIAASILVGVSSGFGGLLVFLGVPDQLPGVSVDLWVVDSNTYWSLLWNPLFPYSLTLMLLVIYWLDRGTREARKADFWFSGLATGVLALIHPYSQLLLYTFAAILTVVRRQAGSPAYLWRYFAALLPFGIYLAWAAVFHPLVARHNAAGGMKSTPLTAYALGFGIPLLLCAGGFMLQRGKALKPYWQIILWFLLSVSFSYLPVWFQRKFIFGAHVPLCLLAGISFDLLLTRCSKPRTRKRVLAIATVILLPLLISTPVYLSCRDSREARRNVEGTYFISDETMAGLKFLKEKTRPNEIVLATLKTSRLIPALSGNTVVWGHWAMSVDLRERVDWFGRFFNDRSIWNDPRRSSQFWGLGIQYVFADGELKHAMERNPEMWRLILADADRVFANDSVIIYKHRDR